MSGAHAGGEHRTSTDPAHEDPVLRGRTYSIPFDEVWSAAVELARGRMPRWTVVREDDGPGVIHAEVKPRLWGDPADVLLRIGLDHDAQTRVYMVSSSRGQGRDWGASRRRVVRFFKALDRSLSVPTDPGTNPGTDPAANG